MTFDLAAQLQLVQELRHLILVQAKRFLHGFTAELHTAEREEIERELFQRLRRRFQRCRIKRAGTGLIVTVRAFAESTAENQRLWCWARRKHRHRSDARTRPRPIQG